MAVKEASRPASSRTSHSSSSPSTSSKSPTSATQRATAPAKTSSAPAKSGSTDRVSVNESAREASGSLAATGNMTGLLGGLADNYGAKSQGPAPVGETLQSRFESGSLKVSPDKLVQTMHDDLHTAPGLSEAQKGEMSASYLKNMNEGGPIGLKQPYGEFSNDVRSLYSSRGLGNEEIVVHGSSASGQSSKGGDFRFTGATKESGGMAASDIDVAARVSPEKFKALGADRVAELKAQGKIPDGIKGIDDFLQHEGKLTKGVEGFRNNYNNGIIRAYNIPGGDPPVSTSQEAIAQTAGRKVQMSVVKQGGAFDDASRIPLKGSGDVAAAEAGAASKLGTAMRVGGGTLGLVGGGLQTAHGVNELRDGKIVDGTADVTSGSANMVAGGALLAGAGGLAAGAGGVGALVDGGRDVIQGIRNGNTEQTVVGGVKSGAGAMMMAGAMTGNPLLVAGGAVVYGGAVIYQNREAIGKFASATADKVGQMASDAGHAISNGVSAVGDALSGAWGRVGSLFW